MSNYDIARDLLTRLLDSNCNWLSRWLRCEIRIWSCRCSWNRSHDYEDYSSLLMMEHDQNLWATTLTVERGVLNCTIRHNIASAPTAAPLLCSSENSFNVILFADKEKGGETDNAWRSVHFATKFRWPPSGHFVYTESSCTAAYAERSDPFE